MLTDATARRLFNAFGPEGAAEAGLFSPEALHAEADALMIRLDVGDGRNKLPGQSLVSVVNDWITTAYGPADPECPDAPKRAALVGRVLATGLFTPADAARLEGRKLDAVAVA